MGNSTQTAIKYQCPVCGFGEMTSSPICGYICPCCGTEFEVDDDEKSHAQLRQVWVAGGYQWFSKATMPPENWNAERQLESLAAPKGQA